ncbi:hypothetical protein DSECCO2_157190 [anaerobic digester metagenome]
MKKCACCGIEKDESEFSKNKRNSDGLHSYCKECNKMKAKAFNKTDKGKENVKNAQRKQFESGYFKYGKGAISNMSKSAEHRGIEFSLTEDSLSKWWNSHEDKCYYCGITIDKYRMIRDYVINYAGENIEILRFKKFFKLDIHAKINDMTIDRKDNSKGYLINNIVKSCWICNSLKSDFYNEHEMKIVGKLIVSSLLDNMENKNAEGK